MKCPVCHHEDTKVIDSRVAADGLSIRRRRECLKCSFRFSTYEEMEILDLSIVKKDGKKESYSRDKMTIGIKRAIEKRPVTEDDLKKLIHSIERELQKINKNEISSEQIGDIIMKHLKKIDKVAYIRFASVCLSFEDLNDFQEELEKLLIRKKKK